MGTVIGNMVHDGKANSSHPSGLSGRFRFCHSRYNSITEMGERNRSVPGFSRVLSIRSGKGSRRENLMKTFVSTRTLMARAPTLEIRGRRSASDHLLAQAAMAWAG